MCFLLFVLCLKRCFSYFQEVFKKKSEIHKCGCKGSHRDDFKGRKRSGEVFRAKGVRLKSPSKCMVSRALRHNQAETYKFWPCFPKLCMGNYAEVHSRVLCQFQKCIGAHASKHDCAFFLFLQYLSRFRTLFRGSQRTSWGLLLQSFLLFLLATKIPLGEE